MLPFIAALLPFPLLAGTPSWTCAEGQEPAVLQTETGTEFSCLLDGERTGPFEARDREGRKIREGHYELGAPHGIFLAWFENGQLRSEGAYRQGRMQGLWRRWYPSGRLKDETRFEDGEISGTRLSWNEDGSPARGESRLSYQLLAFRAGATAILYQGALSTVTGRADWAPAIRYRSSLELRLLPHLIPTRNQSSNRLLLLFGVLVATGWFPWPRIGVEGRAGFQALLGIGTTGMAGLSLVWRPFLPGPLGLSRIGVSADIGLRQALRTVQLGAFAELSSRGDSS